MLVDTPKIKSAFCPMLTGLSYGTTYFIFFDDPDLLGGAVSYQYSTVKADALNHAGRFFAGSITTPVSGGADTIGNNDGGTGAQTGILLISYASAQSSTVYTNPTYAIDHDTSTAATCTSATPTGITVSGFQNIAWPSGTVTLKVRSGVSANAGTASVSYTIVGGGSGTIYSTTTTRAVQVDSVALPVGTNLANLQVSQLVSQATVSFYEAWVEITN